MKEKINIMNGFNFVTEAEATFFVDKSKFMYTGKEGEYDLRVGYELYVKVDKKHYPIRFDGSDFYIEILGMTKEDWKKYNYDQLIK